MGKVKLAKKATKATLKGSKYIWNPTNWVDLIWDAAVDTATDAAFGALEDAIAGEQEQPQLEVQNNYTYNTYVTNKTVTNPVIPQIFPPKYNYQQPPRIWRSPPQISLPDPILPTDIDNQTATQTPVGASINVGAAVQNDRYKMGKTIFHPASTQKKAIRRKVPKNFLALAYQNAQNEAIKAIDTLKNGQPAPIEYSGWLVGTKSLAGLKGDGHILVGINSISALAQTYRALSSIATIEPTNEVPIEYEEIDIDDDFTDLRFNGKSENMPSDDLASKLGYEENEFKQKTVEDIIKDYGKKQYETGFFQRLFSGNLPPINKIEQFGIENIEQFVLHILASQFFRSGLHRLPAEVPESLILDEKYLKNPSQQPTILIDDAMEWQEYILKNLDGIFGQFPLNFTYKGEDDKGNPTTKTITFPNIAETLTEIVGILIGVSKDSDTAVALGVKNLIQTVACLSASIEAADTARANADYLAYKSKEIEKEITIPYNPEATSLKEFLEEKQVKISTFDNVDKETLQQQLKLISTAAQITKAALGKNKKERQGDVIRNRRQEEKTKFYEKWQETIKKYDGTSPNQNPSTKKPFPNAKIIDKSVPSNPQQ